MRPTVILAAAVLAFAAAGLAEAGEATARGKRPNIIVIMVDDMGFSDIGCFGSEIATPHLDRLAMAGVRLTSFYNTSRCCPSRACILTGLYPHQTGLGRFVGKPKGSGPEFIGYQGAMKRPNVTMAEVLGPAGYTTAMAGKWHVSSKPQDRGFERTDAVFLAGARSYFPLKGKRGKGGEVGKVKWTYITDWFADAVVDYVDDSAKDDKPLFVYWAPTAPHWPLHAKAADVEKYRGVYDAGPKAIADARYRKMLELGLFDGKSEWQAPPILSDEGYAENWWTEYRLDTDEGPEEGYKKRSWKSGKYESTRNTRDGAVSMAVYAAQIDCLDQGIGRVLAALEKAGQLDNTLIMFCSDNGCSNESYGTGNHWAQVSDTPFLRYKKSAWEGGVCTPFIMYWPAKTAAESRGSINPTAGHLVDIMATVLDAAGATWPAKDLQDRELPAGEGRSLLPILQGGKVPLKNPIGIEHCGNRALITQGWKLTKDGGDPAWRLFDLRTDRFERKDVAGANADKVAELTRAWDEWAARTGARADGGSSKKK